MPPDKRKMHVVHERPGCRSDSFYGSSLILGHKTAVSNCIGTKNSGELTFKILFIGHLDHLLVMGLKKMMRLGKELKKVEKEVWTGTDNLVQYQISSNLSVV